MPIFDYKCSCGHEFEELVFSRHDTPECPECGGKEVEKKLSVFSTNGVGTQPFIPEGCCGGGACGNSSCELN